MKEDDLPDKEWLQRPSIDRDAICVNCNMRYGRHSAAPPNLCPKDENSQTVYRDTMFRESSFIATASEVVDLVAALRDAYEILEVALPKKYTADVRDKIERALKMPKREAPRVAIISPDSLEHDERLHRASQTDIGPIVLAELANRQNDTVTPLTNPVPLVTCTLRDRDHPSGRDNRRERRKQKRKK